jgi:hypothetical protein
MGLTEVVEVKDGKTNRFVINSTFS